MSINSSTSNEQRNTCTLKQMEAILAYKVEGGLDVDGKLRLFKIDYFNQPLIAIKKKK